MVNMRTFIAVPIAEELRKKLSLIGKEFKRFGDLKIVESENMHLTLKFLGEISEKKADDVRRELQKISSAGFEVSIKGLGVFPNRNYVRVLWAGVERGGKEVISLQNEVDNLMQPLGFEPEKNHTPHLTLARIRFLREKEGFNQTLDKQGGEEFGIFKVEKIDFMESRLLRTGPAYSEITSIYLK